MKLHKYYFNKYIEDHVTFLYNSKTMFVNKAKLLLFVSYFFLKSQGLEKIDSKENDIILVTESILRNTTNNLFLGLRFNKQGNAKIKQALLLHSFFTSVSLKDHNTINVIFQLSRTNKNKVNNETEQNTEIINEILNEDWTNDDVDSLANIEDIVDYVDEFLNNLKGYKENSSRDDYEKLDIKDEIIHILKSDNPSIFNPSFKQNQTKAPASAEDNTDNEFWAPQPSRRIYRGERTKIKHFPFMASIQIFKTFQCAGSIIKSDLIVTAASCLQLAWNNRFFRENPAFLSTRVGSNFYNGGGEEIPVLEVYFHPSYTPKNLRNNIAVIRLVRHLKFRKHRKRLKKIEIDTQESPLPMTTDGITVVGWGAKGFNNILKDPWSNQIAFAVLDVYHLQECQEIYSREYVTRTNFCAGFVSKGGGACNHDVGGPGVVNGILTGIISFGSPVCGTPDAPTVFTKVGYYADWIEEIMEQDVPRIKAATTLIYPKEFYTLPDENLQPTSYTILPLQITPISTGQEIIEKEAGEENLFKLFLKTIFNSKEVKEFDELLNDYPMKKAQDSKKIAERPTRVIGSINKKITKEKHNKVKRGKHEESKKDETFSQQDENEFHELETNKGYHTSMYSPNPYKNKQKRFTVFNADMIDGEKENDETSMYAPNPYKNKQKRYTIFNADIINDGEKENDEIKDTNVAKLIDNIDTSDTNEKPSDSSEEWRKGDENNNLAIDIGITKMDIDLVTKPNVRISKDKQTEIPLKLNKSDVFTLLYVSDNETNKTLQNVVDVIEDFEDNFSEGLPIEVEGFRDLTFRNNKTNSVLDFLSRSELYDLLSEAIDEVTNNKQSEKRLLLFYFIFQNTVSIRLMSGRR